MSDTDSLALEGLRVLKREAELDAVAVKARNEALAEAIDMLEHPRPRRGRPPRNAAMANPHPAQFGEARANPHPSQSQILEMPERVSGGMAENEPEDAA